MLKQRFMLCPAQAAYAFEDSVSQYRRVQLEGGAGRYRRDVIRSSKLVEAQWVLTPAQYNYFMAFYARFQTKPDPFILPLIIEEAALSDCECWFIPGTFSLTSRQGDIYTVSARLEVMPPQRDAALDDWLITLPPYLGPEWAEYMDRLHRLVNVSLPASLPYPPEPFPEI